MKKFNLYILTLLVCLSFAMNAVSQEYAKALKAPAVYNQYYLNLFLINPANTGFDGQGKLLLNFRNQWAGFESSPKVLTLAIDASAAPNMGLGASIYSENFGVSNQFLAQVNYAYQFQANKDMKMAFGLSGSYIQYNLDNETLTDPLHQSPDPKINGAVNGEKYFAADFGFYTEIQNKFKIGISIPHLVETRLDKTNTTTTTPQPDRPVNFTGFVGAIWRMPEYRVVIEPSVGLRKISDVPFGADFNILARMMDDKLFAGFTYSYNPSWHKIAFLGGIKLDKLGIFYSYDQSYLEFQNFNNGSHELTLTLDIFKPKAKAATSDTGMMKKEDLGASKMEEKK
jgi:type IX secretion system PorP/SprF family membrane protein